MKLRSYKLLFRICSFCSDKTNGAHFFVKYKLLLGTMIIGLTGAACSQKKPVYPVDCYVIVPPPMVEDSVEVKDSGEFIGQHIKEDSIVSDIKLTPPIIGPEPEVPMILCYDPIWPDTIVEPESYPEIFYYGMLDVSPIPEEGDLEKFTAWVQSNIEYPKKMLDSGIQGRIIVDFIIDTEGQLTDINIRRSITSEADEEIMRILSESKIWNPGEHKGLRVKTKVTIPVTFRLSED